MFEVSAGLSKERISWGRFIFPEPSLNLKGTLFLAFRKRNTPLIFKIQGAKLLGMTGREKNKTEF
ncbi:MAG: hypothetical protein HF300_05725 [Ignavibacteria bacterium]|jgi:hypothetical protein|nr:hypothetical protein [Ignavibacteria bacterium]MCU7498769.1 hypothetical protein [Ignavibacteria bacterium]MCU7512037.1 hypothetical protein [Ignavibacteria bacterium]MCU7520570.1 hypothetical protein [Ignavibacteria bacterium]MCU7523468.1 hypothetical protein [Ignavibacteria bacterium]